MGKWLRLTARQRRGLERQLKRTRDARLYRRTLALLECDRDKSIVEIARTLRMSRRSIYRWIEAYGESLDPDSLLDEDRPGRPRRWTEECSEWLQALLGHCPAELGYYAVNWNVPLLRDPLEACTAERFSDPTIRRALVRLGYAWKRARYVLEPDPEREKKTADSPGNPAFAAAERRAGPGRDRFAAVSSAARQLEPTGRTEPRFALRPECSPSRFRGHESPHWQAVVFGSSSSEAGGLPGVFEARARALPWLARSAFAGRRPEPYRRRLATTCQRLPCQAPLATEAFARTQSDGYSLGTGQGHRQCQHAVSHDRSTCGHIH
jgi:transposase